MHRRDTILQHSERRLQRNLLDRIFFYIGPRLIIIPHMHPTCLHNLKHSAYFIAWNAWS